MDQILMLVIALSVVGATLVALFVVMGVLFRPWVEGAHELAETQAWRSLLVGLVNVVCVMALVLALAGIGQNTGIGVLSILGVVLLAVAMVGVVFGLAGMSRLVGAHLVPSATQTRQAVWGGIAMTLACLMPYLGWFGLFPYVVVRGLGAFVLMLFGKRQSSAA